MANQPALLARVTITARDLNNNNVSKIFNSVTQLHFDYSVGKLNIVDATGSFYFSLVTVTSLTYTIVSGLNGVTSVVIS